MKWVVFAVALCASLSVPIWIRQRQEYERWIWTAFGLLPFLVSPLHLYMALRSWPLWSGYVKGIEVSLLDLLAIGLLLSLPSRRYSLPFKVPMLLYAAAVALSCFQSDNFEISSGYLVQVGRMFLIYAVVAKASSDETVSSAILRGLAVGVIIQAGVVIYQRFGLGELQATGTFPHQNSLGIASHFVAFPFFALLIRQRKGWLGFPLVAVLSCVIVEILTVSRATIGLAAAGFLIVFIISAASKWTARKATIALAGFACALLLLPIVLGSLSQRVNLTEESDYDERAAFEAAAALVVQDNPWGIGANNYVMVVNTKGYNERAGVVPSINSLSANVHNIYYLVAAETGWLGIGCFLLVLAWPLFYAVRASRSLRGSHQADLLLGLATSLFIVYLHSMFEWTFITWNLQYLAAIAFGLIVGFSMQVRRGNLSGLIEQPSWTSESFKQHGGSVATPKKVKEIGNVRFRQ